MGKPQKLKIPTSAPITINKNSINYVAGYNQACEEWERFLPTQEEIEELLKNWNVTPILGYRHKLAQAISKRLRGK